MNYAFLGKMIPIEMQETVAKLSVYNMQDAANALEWHLYDGLCQNTGSGIRIINVLPIGSYPQYYKKPFIKKTRFETTYEKKNVNVGFCNVKLIRHYALTRKVKKTLLAWCKESEDNRVVFMYTLYAPFLKAIEKAKKKYPTLKSCAIIADLPDMDSLTSNGGFLFKIFNKKLSDSAYSKADLVDMYVLLTRQMADYMEITQPFCVVEGISTAQKEEPSFQPPRGDKKMILYTGTLHKRFGIMNLVDAFRLMKGEEYELVLCGVGDSEAEIRLAAEKDPRIKFLGQMARADILELQKKATVLVNPRQNNEEFTKYSFPSKNLEYLSSGRPLVAYKLDGIPDEYNDYIYYVSDNSLETLRDKLTEVCEMPADQISAHCKNAYEFVQTQKNEVKQTAIILETLRREIFS